MKGHEVIAGIIYHNFIPEFKNIEMSMVATSPRWATKNVIKQLLSYPFNQLNCQRITTCIASRNQRAIKLNQGLGFKHEGTLRKGCGDDDMFVLGMLKEDAKKWGIYE